MAAEPLPSPAAPGSAQPNLARGPAGELVLSWLEPHSQGMALRYSKLAVQGWEPARTVAHGSNWFVNWADFPSVVPISGSMWAAHWLTRRGKSAYAYDVSMAVSRDAGGTWSDELAPHTDGTLTEHGFVSLFPTPAGVGALWLDGRNMTDNAGEMTLRSATIAPDRSLLAEHLVDTMVCDCCQTDVAIGSEGPIAVYRDRSPQDIRDIYVSRFADEAWQTGQPVANDAWKISGCPVNGPAVDASGAHVAVAWYTGANDKPRVRLARSVDGARSFAAPIDVSEIRPMGRVDVVTYDDGTAVVSWLRRSTPLLAELCVRAVAGDGALGPTHVVARTTTARPSGFPQMQRDGEGLILAWTDPTGEQSAVRTVRLDMAP